MIGLLKLVTLHSGLAFASAFHAPGIGALPLQVSDDIGVDAQAFTDAVSAGVAGAPAPAAPAVPITGEVPTIPVDGMFDPNGSTASDSSADAPDDSPPSSDAQQAGSGSDIPAF